MIANILGIVAFSFLTLCMLIVLFSTLSTTPLDGDSLFPIILTLSIFLTFLFLNIAKLTAKRRDIKAAKHNMTKTQQQNTPTAATRIRRQPTNKIEKINSQSSTESSPASPQGQPIFCSNISTRTQQFNETLNILRTTSNCDTFFSRMEFAYLISHEVNSQNWIKYLNDNAIALTEDFINRAIQSESDAIENLKTESGKNNRYNKFREMMIQKFISCKKFYAKNTLEYLMEELDLMDITIFFESKSSKNEVLVDSEVRWTKDVTSEVFQRFVKSIFLSKVKKGAFLGNSPNDYPQYFKYELHTPNPEKLHRELMNDGLVTFADLKTHLGVMTVPEIKALLKEYSLPISGKKEKLIETALLGIPELDLEKRFEGSNLTMLTEYGEFFLSVAEGYTALYRCGWNISLHEYETYRENGITDFMEAAEHILIKRDKKPCFLTKLFLAQLFYAKKEYSRSLSYYIQTMYFETCENRRDQVRFPPENAAKIHSMAEYFTPDMIGQCYTDNPKAHSCYSKEEFSAAVRAALKGELSPKDGDKLQKGLDHAN